MTLEFRRAAKDDRPALFLLFQEVFGAAPSPEEWEWKYDLNPSRSVSIAAFDGLEALGFFGGFATRFVGEAQSSPGTSAVDVMTARAARRLGRSGVYGEMGRRFVEENSLLGIPFCFGFPNDRHLLAGERVLGFRAVERIGQWSRPVGPRTRRPPLARWLRPVREIEEFAEAHDPLAEALAGRPGLRTDRSRRNLNWRFRLRPGVRYRLFEAAGAGRASRGFAVLRLVGDRALVVDLQARDESAGTVPDLLQAVEAAALEAGARTLELRASRRGGLAARARELGLEEIPADASLTMIPVGCGIPLERAMALFDYRFSDHDVF
jgi:hypothetical protein